MRKCRGHNRGRAMSRSWRYRGSGPTPFRGATRNCAWQVRTPGSSLCHRRDNRWCRRWGTTSRRLHRVSPWRDGKNPGCGSSFPGNFRRQTSRARTGRRRQHRIVSRHRIQAVSGQHPHSTGAQVFRGVHSIPRPIPPVIWSLRRYARRLLISEERIGWWTGKSPPQWRALPIDPFLRWNWICLYLEPFWNFWIK